MKKRTGRVLCAATLMGMLAGSVIPVCAAENGDSLDPVTLHFIFYGDKKSATDEVWDAIAGTTIYPEYFKINGEWKMLTGSRMDCSVVIKDGMPFRRERRP